MLGSRRAALFVSVGVAGGVLGVAALGLWALPALFPGRVLPGVRVGGIAVGGKTADEARAILVAALEQEASRISFVLAGSGEVAVPSPAVLETTLAEIGITPNLDATVAAAFAVGREQGWAGVGQRFGLLGGFGPPPSWNIDRTPLAAYFQRQLAHVLREPREPSWELTADGAFAFQPGEAGTGLPLEEVLAAIERRLAGEGTGPVPLTLVRRPPTMSDPDARVAGQAVARVTAQPLTLVTDETEISVAPSVLESWVRLGSAVQAGAGGALADPELDRAAIERYLRTVVASKVARPSRDAQFEVEGNPPAAPGAQPLRAGRATLFVPASPGTELLVPESSQGILRGLAAGADRIKLATRPVPPRVLVTPHMEQYGVRALVARGESDFARSPKNRIHNIRVGAEKYHGLLIPPGAEFSFNGNLGPVDAANGFLPELVILANVTTPQYGGGLCQVSTTMFRSAINAGLPITARKNHAYAVSYYGTPGFDATIYPPNPDLRFVNDTPGHLLVQMKLEGTKLAFEFWGTPDGRQVEVIGPFPYDRQASGAVKATLVRKITRAGETTRDEWYSNYKSPKLFPKVLAANAETETWEERVARIAERDRQAHEAFKRKKAELERHAEQGAAKPRPTPKPTPTPPPE